MPLSVDRGVSIGVLELLTPRDPHSSHLDFACVK
jgi:hypothetical protein